MPRKLIDGRPRWNDPDDAPELTQAFFQRAELRDGTSLIRRGRPPSPDAKQLVSLRLDPSVLAGLRATGPGWQTRANTVLKNWLARQRHSQNYRTPLSERSRKRTHA